MPCNRPITAYYSAKVNEGTGKRSLVFNRGQSYKGSDLRYSAPLEISCGKCHGCKADQALMWSIRSYHEASLHQQNSFITLTYDDAHLPEDGKIYVPELQYFFKRVRKSGERIRYIACGEYGGLTRRPHYHAIIFGKDWLEGSIPLKDEMYTHQGLSDLWGKGFVSIAPVNMATICYVCGYVNKKIDDPDTFNLMSRRPGIGHTWIDKFYDDVVRTGVVSIEGQQYQVPKRYLLWHEDELAAVKQARTDYARSKSSDSVADFYAQDGREINLKQKKISKQELL